MNTLSLKNSIFQLVDKIDDKLMLQEINLILTDYIQYHLYNHSKTLSDYEKDKILAGLSDLEAGLEVKHSEILVKSR